MQKAYKTTLLGGAVFGGLLLFGSAAFAQEVPDASASAPDMGMIPEGGGSETTGRERPRSELKKKRNESASPQPSPAGTPTPQAP